MLLNATREFLAGNNVYVFAYKQYYANTFKEKAMEIFRAANVDVEFKETDNTISYEDKFILDYRGRIYEAKEYEGSPIFMEFKGLVSPKIIKPEYKKFFDNSLICTDEGARWMNSNGFNYVEY